MVTTPPGILLPLHGGLLLVYCHGRWGVLLAYRQGSLDFWGVPPPMSWEVWLLPQLGLVGWLPPVSLGLGGG